MIKISFMNQKGGVGKTTTTVNLAAAVSKILKKRVLVVDCDTQRDSSQYLLGFDPDEENIYTLADHFKLSVSAKDIIRRIQVPQKNTKVDTNIWLIPSSNDVLNMSLTNVHAVRDFLKPLEDQFDYCFIDLPPRFNGVEDTTKEGYEPSYNVALSALVSSDYVIIPAFPSRFALSGYSNLLKSIQIIRRNGWNLKLSVLGVLYNNVNLQKGVERFIINNRNNTENAFNCYIRNASDVQKSELFGIPLVYFIPNSNIAEDYKAVAKEMVKRIKNSEVTKRG